MSPLHPFARPLARAAALAALASPLAIPLVPAPAAAQTAAQGAAYDTAAFAALSWREVGPYRGGRSVAVAGSRQRPHEYWMGTTGGGVFKTTDGGMNWQPVTDKYFGGTIGAIEVDPQNPDVVWVGGGETPIRGNTSHGEGVWLTRDAGKTWSYMGLRETEHISRVKVHPRNSQTVYVAALGKVFEPTPDRGIYRTTDGGRTWEKILFVHDSAGAIDFQFDPSNPDVIYAAFWQAGRTPWMLSSGGQYSGIHKSTDGGRTWQNITPNLKLPSNIVGKIGLAVSPAKPSRIWAQVEHDSGGVYRSDDGGATWEWVNKERKLRQRAWYYSRLFADPKDSNIVYGLNVQFFRSRDGGKTFPQNIQVPHGDNHDLWIAPDDPQRMVQGNDGGANVSFNGGRSWTDQDFATAQFYHVTTTNEYPYKICGAQQDNSTLCGPSRQAGGIDISAWYDAGGCESGYIAANPAKPNITFAGCYGGNLERKDRETGFTRDVTVYPINPMGQSSEDIAVRFQWTFPIVFSRHDPNVLYAAGSRLFRSTNEGESWTAVSPDLARKDPKTMGPSGGPITRDQTGVETYALIFAFDESPVTRGLLWAGTDDGLVHISRNNGTSWTNVTPPDIGDFTRVSIIEPSRWAQCSAYLAANRYQLGDKRPILYKTADCGRTWTKIVNGIPATEFTRVIREDPVRRGLLYAGTERGVWISFDDGASWQSLKKNLPPVPVHDLTVKDADIVVATHGRSFYVMDDISPIRQLTPAIAAKTAHLYEPQDAFRTNWGGGFGGGGGQSPSGANPPSGVTVYYALKTPNQTVTLDFLDRAGKLIRSFTSDPDSATLADSLRGVERRRARVDSLVRSGLSQDSAQRLASASVEQGQGGGGGGGGFGGGGRPPRVPNKAGLNQFNWNLLYPDASRFDGLIMWAANTVGPIAPPGTYSVRMKVGNETQTQTFLVKKDPRSTATQADLDAQFRFLVAVRDRVTEANDAVRTVRNVRWQVGDRREKIAGKPQAADFTRDADSLMRRLAAAEEEIYQVRNQSNQDPLNYPIKLNNKIAALMGVASSGEYRPTRQTLAAFDTLSKALQVELTRIEAVLGDLLPKVNATLRAAGLDPIVPSTAERPSRPNVAMDDDDVAEVEHR